MIKFIPYERYYLYRLYYTKSTKIYNINSLYSLAYIYAIDEESINKLMTFLYNPQYQNIADNDVLYFVKNTNFPKSNLKNLQVPITRCIKEPNSTKVVISTNNIPNTRQLELGYIISDVKEYDKKKKFFITDLEINKTSLDEVKRQFPGTCTRAILYQYSQLKIDTVEQIINSPNKITTVQILGTYLQDKLPSLDEDSKKILINLLHSSPEDQQLAFSILTTSNLSNSIYDIFISFYNKRVKFNNKLLSSINVKYIQELLNVKFNQLAYNLSYLVTTRRLATYLSPIYHIPFISKDQQKKLLVGLYNAFIKDNTYDNIDTKNGQIIVTRYQPTEEDIIEFFNTYNLPYDEIRKTEIGN